MSTEIRENVAPLLPSVPQVPFTKLNPSLSVFPFQPTKSGWSPCVHHKLLKETLFPSLPKARERPIHMPSRHLECQVIHSSEILSSLLSFQNTLLQFFHLSTHSQPSNSAFLPLPIQQALVSLRTTS